MLHERQPAWLGKSVCTSHSSGILASCIFVFLCGHNSSNNYPYCSIRWVNINHLAVTHFPSRMRKEPKKKSGLQNVTSYALLLASLMSLSANSFRALRRMDDFFLFLFYRILLDALDRSN